MKEVGELCPLERRVGMGEMVFPEILRGPPQFLLFCRQARKPNFPQPAGFLL